MQGYTWRPCFVMVRGLRKGYSLRTTSCYSPVRLSSFRYVSTFTKDLEHIDLQDFWIKSTCIPCFSGREKQQMCKVSSNHSVKMLHSFEATAINFIFSLFSITLLKLLFSFRSPQNAVIPNVVKNVF